MTKASFHMVVGSLKTGIKKFSHYCDFQTIGYYIPSKLHINLLPNCSTIITKNSTIWKGRIFIICILFKHSTIFLPLPCFLMQRFFYFIFFCHLLFLTQAKYLHCHHVFKKRQVILECLGLCTGCIWRLPNSAYKLVSFLFFSNDILFIL